MRSLNRRTALTMLVSTLTASKWIRAGAVSLYTSELTGWSVEVRGDHLLLDHTVVEEYPHGTGERFYLSSINRSGKAEISFFDDTDTPIITIDVLLAEFESRTSHLEVIERGSVASTTYALVSFRAQQTDGYYYIEVAQDVTGNVDMLQGFSGASTEFLTELGFARDDVTIDGAPFLGAPVVDLAAVVSAHQQRLAELAATPVVNLVAFRLYPAELRVTSPVTVYDHYTSDVLETVYFHSSSGAANGLVGFLRDDSPTARDVLTTIVSNQPQGEQPPEELRLDVSDDDSALGLYLVPGSAGDMAMLIRVTRADPDFWRIESIAAPPDDMVGECAELTAGTQIDGVPLFDRVDFVQILQSLSGS